MNLLSEFRIKLSNYRPAITAFLLSVAVSVPSIALTFLNQPVSGALGVGLGSFTLYVSICGIVSAVALPFVGQWIGKYSIKKVLLVTAFWTGATLFLYSFANQLWMFYVIAALSGILYSSAVTLSINVIIQTYYESSQAASLLGIVMTGSGLGGVVFSSLMPKLLETFGWRFGYRLLSVCWISIILIAVAVLGDRQPMTQSGQKNISADDGMTRAEALKSPVFYLVIIAMMLLSFGAALSQHVPSILNSNGFSAEQIAKQMSFYTAALAATKILHGFLYAKLGVEKGGFSTHAMWICGLVMLSSTALIYPALAFLAVGMGIVTTLFPVLCKRLFGQKEYAQIYSLVTTSLTAGGFLATPLWGLVYDTTGSFTLGLVVMAVLVPISFACQIAAIKMHERSNKNKH